MLREKTNRDIGAQTWGDVTIVPATNGAHAQSIAMMAQQIFPAADLDCDAVRKRYVVGKSGFGYLALLADVVGYVGFCVGRVQESDLVLQYVGVEAPYRHRKVAASLIHAVQDEAAAVDYRIVIRIAEDNDPALKMLVRCGFLARLVRSSGMVPGARDQYLMTWRHHEASAPAQESA